MTDRPAPITDEDLSAHLDGQATPELADRIGSDPDVQARLEALRDAARTVAETPVTPLEDAAVDLLVGRALLAFDVGAGAPAEPAAVPGPAKERRPSFGPSDPAPTPGSDVPRALVPPTTGRRLPPTWLVAAAVALVVAFGIGLVVTGGDRGRNDQAVSTAPTESTSRDQGAGSKAGETDSADAAGPQLPDHGSASGAAPSTTLGRAFAATGTIDLGRFDSADALRTALASRFPEDPATASSGGAPAAAALQRCGTQVAVALDLESSPLHVGYATVAGRQVLVYEFPSTSYTDETPTSLVAAVGTQACDPVLTFQR